MPTGGDVVHIGPRCGVQFGGGRDIYLKVGDCRTFGHTPDGMAYINGRVLDPVTGTPTASKREVLVIVAGLRRIPPAPARVRKPRNQARTPAQRTPTAITTGSTR